MKKNQKYTVTITKQQDFNMPIKHKTSDKTTKQNGSNH